MKNVELRLIYELTKNSRRSDRELSKEISVSQPTVSRMIKKFEKEGIIHEYTAIPDFAKLGIEIIAIVTYKVKQLQSDQDRRMERAREFAAKHPNLIFASSGIGSHSDRVGISVHKSYSDYAEFMKDVKEYLEPYDIVETFLIDIKGERVPKSFSLKSLIDYVTKEKPQT